MASKNLTRKDLSKKIYQTIGFSKSFSLSIVDDFFNILVDELRRSNKVKISSFGTFKIINKKERVGRNPKTKIETKIPSRKVIVFKASSKMRKKINRS
tara:strand:+ start:4886 stop:5179 length:294 start_codon:yes stop_codon:yes gene_type:complete